MLNDVSSVPDVGCNTMQHDVLKVRCNNMQHDVVRLTCIATHVFFLCWQRVSFLFCVFSMCSLCLVCSSMNHALCVPLGCSLRSLCFVYSLCAVLLCVLLLCAVALGTFGENAKYVRYFAIA